MHKNKPQYTHSLLVGLVVLFFISTSPASAQEKPNILWITIEDTSPEFVGCYGNSDAMTPIIDQLALDGVRFRNAV